MLTPFQLLLLQQSIRILSLYSRTFFNGSLGFLDGLLTWPSAHDFPFCFKPLSSHAVLALIFGISHSILFGFLVLKGFVLPGERNESFRAALYLDVDGLIFSCS
jgi:hypothetical protein